MLKVPMALATWSKAQNIITHSNNGIVGASPIRGMDVCLNFSAFVLSCAGSGFASDSPPKESYQLAARVAVFVFILKCEQTAGHSPGKAEKGEEEHNKYNLWK
jgi:hypothetical protein